MTSPSDAAALQAIRDALNGMRRQCGASISPPEDIALWLSGALLEYLYETTMAIALLLEHGYPDLPAVPVRAPHKSRHSEKIVGPELASADVVSPKHLPLRA
jgi:hypothetical protein